MVLNDFDLKTEDLNERTTLHTSQNASSKNGLNKESVLAKYEETNQNDEIEGFENLNDLSFSKYSKFSKASIIVGSDPKSRTSTLDSPFAKKLKEDLNVEFTSDNTKPYYPTVYPIYEFDNNDENSDSPFLDYQNEKGHIPQKLSGQKLRKQQQQQQQQSEAEENFKQSNQYARLQSTPKHQRTSSVKVSLTPAQKFEKRTSTRLHNALDNFKLTTLVGNGAFASVYRAVNLKTNQVIAIKQIRIEKDQDVGVLMGEIDLLKILKHRNIVKYHGFVKTATSLNVLLEYCEGGSLRQLYKKLKKGLPEYQIINYVRQILEGLNYLHEQGVVHRDVKAANVLLTDKGDVKLADFGVATKVTSQHLTVVGTPNWMAPETVLGGEGICTASDIWSLGATIIELFTTNPPYHDLNAMATLHAIGTDEHPPLPKNMSTLAKDFLLECFQKQANLRISAKLLLKHKWLNQTATAKTSMATLLRQPSRELRSIKIYSESNDENWDEDFEEIKVSKFQNSTSSIIELKPDNTEKQFKLTEYSKKDLLTLFADEKEDTLGNFEFETIGPNKLAVVAESMDESDPFLNIDIENFDTNELEVQSKMEYLVVRLSRKLEQVHLGYEDAVPALVKVTGRMLHLVKKYPVLHDTLIRDHGVLSLLELLESFQDIPSQQQLWYHCLSILNHVFESDLGTLENFCFLGGIPTVAHFRSATYEVQVRLQVAKFIGILNLSEKALSMFVSCGGLRLVSKFVEEDFDTTPTFPLIAIESIHNILAKDLSRSKSDLCRILSKHGVIFWLVVLLNRLVKYDQKPLIKNVSKEQVEITIERIIDIIKYFSQSETKVRISIGSIDLFKLIFKLFDNLKLSHQLTLLKFVKSMSCISEVLKNLYHAEILEFLVKLLKSYIPSKGNYKEIINVLAPILYNSLALNHRRESEFVNLGGLPYLKTLSIINLPFRQFILPIICEFVHCDASVVNELKKNDIVKIYYNLLLDPYWQSNALDSLHCWYKLEPSYIDLNSPMAVDCLVGGFLLPKVSNLESTLEIYFKLLTNNLPLTRDMLNMNVINSILIKLSLHDKKNPVIQLLYLKVLKCLINYLVDSKSSLPFAKPVVNTLQSLKLRQSSLLIEEVTTELLLVLK